MARVGIVTVLYNSDEVLPEFFASLALQKDVSFRLYVIDNGTTDSGTRLSESLAREHGIDAVCVFNNANVGVAKGNNQGIALALADGCPYVLLANNDTAFSADTLRLLLEPLEGGAEQVSTPKIMYHGEPTRLWYGGGHINPWLMRTPHHQLKEVDRGQTDGTRYVGYAPTCFMMLDARVFERIGRMDEQYFVYYDDTDFVWRLSAAGLRIRYVPAAVVMHKVSTSTGGELSPFSLYYTNRNRVYFIRKNLHGLQKAFALAYMMATRIPRVCFLPAELSKRAWAGVRDGFMLPLASDTHQTKR